MVLGLLLITIPLSLGEEEEAQDLLVGLASSDRIRRELSHAGLLRLGRDIRPAVVAAMAESGSNGSALEDILSLLDGKRVAVASHPDWITVDSTLSPQFAENCESILFQASRDSGSPRWPRNPVVVIQAVNIATGRDRDVVSGWAIGGRSANRTSVVLYRPYGGTEFAELLLSTLAVHTLPSPSQECGDLSRALVGSPILLGIAPPRTVVAPFHRHGQAVPGWSFALIGIGVESRAARAVPFPHRSVDFLAASPDSASIAYFFRGDLGVITIEDGATFPIGNPEIRRSMLCGGNDWAMAPWDLWSPDSSRLAYPHEGKLFLWDRQARQSEHVFCAPFGVVTALAWAPLGTEIAMATEPQAPGSESAVFVVDAATGRTRDIPISAGGVVRAITWSPDATLLCLDIQGSLWAISTH